MTSNMNWEHNLKYTISTDTESGKKIHTLEWTVSQFIKLLENKIYIMRELRTEKPKDDFEESIDSRFQLKIQFLGRDNDMMEIYFLSPNSVTLKSILTISDLARTFTEDYRAVPGNKWQYLATLYNKDLFVFIKDGFYKRNPYFQCPLNSLFKYNGSLLLNLQCIVIPNDIKVDGSNVPGTQLYSDFENLLNSGILSDVTMKSAEGNEYKVHKAVLANRSVVLKAHFEHNTIECQTNIVESPLDAEVLIEVLNFIYSDKAPRVDEIPERLLAAADYYQLSRLKSLCAEALHKRLTVENAIETLQLADLHSTKMLKRLTLEFIKDNAKLITRTDGWANLKSAKLVKTVYEYIMADDFEADIK